LLTACLVERADVPAAKRTSNDGDATAYCWLRGGQRSLPHVGLHGGRCAPPSSALAPPPPPPLRPPQCSLLRRQLEVLQRLYEEQHEDLERSRQEAAALRGQVAALRVDRELLLSSKARLVDVSTQNAHMVAACAENSQKLKRLEVGGWVGGWARCLRPALTCGAASAACWLAAAAGSAWWGGALLRHTAVAPLPLGHAAPRQAQAREQQQ